MEKIDVFRTYAENQIGYGVSQMIGLLDTIYPTGILGQPVSLVLDLLGTIGGVVGGYYLNYPYDEIVSVLGAYISTDLLRHLETMLTPPAVTYTTPTGQQTGSVTYVTQNSVAVKPIPLSTGRYRVTG